MTEWKDTRGLGPSGFAFEKSANKLAYNVGSAIKRNTSPVWSVEDFSGTLVTDHHAPCGYWYDDPTWVTLPEFVYPACWDTHMLEIGGNSAPVDLLVFDDKLYAREYYGTLYQIEPDLSSYTKVAANPSERSYIKRLFVVNDDLFLLRMVHAPRIYKWNGSSWVSTYYGSSANGGSYCIDDTGMYIGRHDRISYWDGTTFIGNKISFDDSDSIVQYPRIEDIKLSGSVLHVITASAYTKDRFDYYIGLTAGGTLNKVSDLITSESQLYSYFTTVIYDGYFWMTSVGGNLRRCLLGSGEWEEMIAPASSWSDYRNMYNIHTMLVHSDGNLYALRQNGMLLRLADTYDSWEDLTVGCLPTTSVGNAVRTKHLVEYNYALYGVVVTSNYWIGGFMKYSITTK
jgi:hypothetical protein